MRLQVIPGLSSKSFSSVAPQLQQDQEFDARYVEYFNRSHILKQFLICTMRNMEIFNRADIDGWEVRKGMADLCAMDLVPEPM